MQVFKIIPYCHPACNLFLLTVFANLKFLVAGHYLLTMLLMDKLKNTAKESGIEGRIMFTGSEAHRVTYAGGVDFDTLTMTNSDR